VIYKSFYDPEGRLFVQQAGDGWMATIPLDEKNAAYQSFLIWLKSQNKTLEQWREENPAPAPTDPKSLPPSVEERLAKLEADVTTLKAAKG